MVLAYQSFFPCARGGKLQIAGHQILEGLPAHCQAGLPPPDQYQGGAAEAVVVGGHGEVIGPCGEHRQQIPPPRLGEGDVLLDQVAALTAPAGQGAEEVPLLPHPAGGENGVRGLVKGVAGVVGHAAVDGDVAAVALDGLHPPHLVEGKTGVGHDAPAGLQEDPGHRVVLGGAALLQVLGQGPDVAGDVHHGVALHIPHPEAAPQVQGAGHEAVGCPHGLGEVQEDVHRVAEGLGLEDLGADVAVEALHLQVLLPQGRRHEPGGLAGLNGHAELAVDPPGVDGLEGVGVNPRGHPEEDPLPDAPGPGGLVQPVQLLEVVHDEAAHPAVQGVGDVLVGLVVAVEVEPLRGKPPARAV